MRKSLLLLAVLSFLLCSCESKTIANDLPESATASAPAPAPEYAPPRNLDLPRLTKQEILDFDLLRIDWTKEQMEKLKLNNEVNELAGETKFYNDVVKYTYFDWYNMLTPAVIDVYGDYPGPRGIRVGDTFESVMDLFPQETDWRSNSEGVFYGSTEPPAKSWIDGERGNAYLDPNGDKDITLTILDNSSFMRIFFIDDVVTHFTFFTVHAS